MASPSKSSLFRLVRFALVAAAVFALSIWRRATPVEERAMPPLDDRAAHQDIAEELSEEDARVYLGYVEFVRDSKKIMDVEALRQFTSVTVKQALFVGRNAGILPDSNAAADEDAADNEQK